MAPFGGSVFLEGTARGKALRGAIKEGRLSQSYQFIFDNR